jgi:hypothetical protein
MKMHLQLSFHKESSKNPYTWSPLHWACRKGSTAVVNLLLQNGLNEFVVTTMEPEGRWTPYEIAVFHQNENLVCNPGHDTAGSIGANLHLLRSSNSSEAKQHGSYLCDGCKHVRTVRFVLFRNTNRLGYIRYPISLLGLCRF